jgi:hypothetical protein
MMSLIHYLSASRRLKEYEKTIKMMGSDPSTFLLAQRDMIEMEKKYYEEECDNLMFKTFFFCIIVGITSCVIYILS